MELSKTQKAVTFEVEHALLAGSQRQPASACHACGLAFLMGGHGRIEASLLSL